MKLKPRKNKELTRSMRLLIIFLLAAVVMIMGPAVSPTWALHGRLGDWDNGEEIPFEEAELYFELNNTDGDLGIHSLIDGDAWKNLKIEDPKGREMLAIEVKGRLSRQGLTEIFFESAEPSFDELTPEQFFRRFPEGEYEIEGITLEGEELESTVWLSHVMPAPPAPTVNGSPMAVQCDEDEAGYDATLVSGEGVTIAWSAVTMSHPDSEGGGAGVQPPVPVTIKNYEVVLEVETEDGFASNFSVILPAVTTSFEVPADFLGLGDEFKYEVLAREANGNQTAVESCFVVNGDE